MVSDIQQVLEFLNVSDNHAAYNCFDLAREVSATIPVFRTVMYHFSIVHFSIIVVLSIHYA